MSGIVYLVGAGPGDSGLLTVKARDLIESADVIVYDRLVSSEIMAKIPETVELIDVGKNAGNHPVPQDEINKILLAEAQKDKKVVRLKGGDPFVFGRGGEELELLSKSGIEFQVVPGITSSIAVPAYAGIPVTHRDFCSSLHIITGHARAGSEIKIDFDALVRLNGTLIFMMSVSTVGQIANGLMEAGMDKAMPCAVIENGTYPGQRKFISDLANIEATVRDNEVKSPAVIMVGKVCTLSDDFDWFGKLPLKGKRFIVTQPANKASRMGEGLKALGAEVTLYPCIETKEIRPLDPHFEDYDTLVFTSSEGVKSFAGWLFEQGMDVRALYGKKLACIGSATADELMRYGIKADFIPEVYSGECLAKDMIENSFVARESRILMLRAKEGSQDINRIFDDAGIDYTDYAVYRTKLIEHEKIEDLESYDTVTFTSRSCVNGFVESQKCDDFKGVKALCIGQQTAEEAVKFGFDVTISDKATIASMLEKAAEMVIDNGRR